MKVTCRVSDMDFRDVLSDTHKCAYPIRPHNGFPKIFASKRDGSVRLNHMNYIRQTPSSHKSRLFRKGGRSAF